MYKCHGNKLFLLNKTNTLLHISSFLIFLMQRKRKANVKQLKPNIFYVAVQLSIFFFVSSPLWIWCATGGDLGWGSRCQGKLAGEVDVHMGKVWATARCPHAATRNQTTSTLPVEIAPCLFRGRCGHGLQRTIQTYPLNTVREAAGCASWGSNPLSVLFLPL